MSYDKIIETTVALNVAAIMKTGDITSSAGMDHIMAIADLKVACDTNEQVSNKKSIDILSAFALTDENGTVHDATKKAFLSIIKGDYPFYHL